MREEMSFEESLARLETIVKELESGDVKLEEAISKFQEAVALAASCDKKLKEAEQNIHKILKEDGTLEDFQPEE